MTSKINKRTFIISVIIFIFIISTAIVGIKYYDKNKLVNVFKDDDSIKYMSKVDTESFYIYKNNKWEKDFIKGVDLGVGKPGNFPGELGITKEEYLDLVNN